LPHIRRHCDDCARERVRRSITAALSTPIQLVQTFNFSLEPWRIQLGFRLKKNADCDPDTFSKTSGVGAGWQLGGFC
jgi:hypothetical protein